MKARSENRLHHTYSYILYSWLNHLQMWHLLHRRHHRRHQGHSLLPLHLLNASRRLPLAGSINLLAQALQQSVWAGFGGRPAHLTHAHAAAQKPQLALVAT